MIIHRMLIFNNLQYKQISSNNRIYNNKVIQMDSNNFIFGSSVCNLQVSTHPSDLINLQTVLLQSIKYSQAKRSKNRYIRSKKLTQLKDYQKKLINIVRKRSDQAVEQLCQYSQRIMKKQQQKNQQTTQDQKEKFKQLRGQLVNIKQEKCQQTMKGKVRIFRQRCQKQLQLMEDKTIHQEDIDQIINDMEKPFKKMISYLSLIKKELSKLRQQTFQQNKQNGQAQTSQSK